MRLWRLGATPDRVTHYADVAGITLCGLRSKNLRPGRSRYVDPCCPGCALGFEAAKVLASPTPPSDGHPPALAPGAES